MEGNKWYQNTEKEIGSLKEKMPKSDYKLYGVELLLRVAKRVDTLSSNCEYCQSHKGEISSLVTDLENLPKITKEEISDYDRMFRNLVRHLEKYHKLHRIVPTAPYILVPLVIAVLVAIISLVMVDAADPTDLGDFILPAMGFIVAGGTFILGVLLGIIRLFGKPI